MVEGNGQCAKGKWKMENGNWQRQRQMSKAMVKGHRSKVKGQMAKRNGQRQWSNDKGQMERARAIVRWQMKQIKRYALWGKICLVCLPFYTGTAHPVIFETQLSFTVHDLREHILTPIALLRKALMI